MVSENYLAVIPNFETLVSLLSANSYPKKVVILLMSLDILGPHISNMAQILTKKQRFCAEIFAEGYAGQQK
jgi:hypothetical protein